MKLRPLVRGPIAARLFVFNILLVFVPAAAFLSLAAFESSLLRSLEHALVQQGRFMAAWLAEGPLAEERAKAAVAALGRNLTARVRIVSADGRLLADSSAEVIPAPAPAKADWLGSLGSRAASDGSAASDKPAKAAEETLLYRIFSLPVRIIRHFAGPPEAPIESADYYAKRGTYDGPELLAAFRGEYGATTRISSGGQVSVTLYAALPISSGGATEGAVLVSQSTYRILRELYSLRLETAKVFAVGALAAAVVSFMLAWTISAPLGRLGKLAAATIGPDGRLENRFAPAGRGDEIDELAKALGSLVGRLGERVSWAERFSADAAHELRNPIAAVRAAAELLPGAEGEARARLEAAVSEGAARMERVVAGLRNLALAESATEGGRADAVAISRNVAERFGPDAARRGVAIEVDADGTGASAVSVDPDRLALALGNLVDNAVSFASTRVLVEVRASARRVTVSVHDDGPGLPPEHASRAFDRFFSWRPDAEGTHSGLGLSIVKAVAERAGGSVRAGESPLGGAAFELVLPEAPPRRGVDLPAARRE